MFFCSASEPPRTCRAQPPRNSGPCTAPYRGRVKIVVLAVGAPGAAPAGATVSYSKLKWAVCTGSASQQFDFDTATGPWTDVATGRCMSAMPARRALGLRRPRTDYSCRSVCSRADDGHDTAPLGAVAGLPP